VISPVRLNPGEGRDVEVESRPSAEVVVVVVVVVVDAKK